MAKYEVISPGIFVKEGAKIRELAVGSIIDDPNEFMHPKLRMINEKSFEVATPDEPDKQQPKKTK